MRSAVLFMAGALALSSCAADVPDYRAEMVGMPAQTVATCMGEPSTKERLGVTQLWKYYRSDGPGAYTAVSGSLPLNGASEPPSALTGKACVVVVKVEKERVTSVDYQTMASGHQDAECASTLDRCAGDISVN